MSLFSLLSVRHTRNISLAPWIGSHRERTVPFFSCYSLLSSGNGTKERRRLKILPFPPILRGDNTSQPSQTAVLIKFKRLLADRLSTILSHNWLCGDNNNYHQQQAVSRWFLQGFSDSICVEPWVEKRRAGWHSSDRYDHLPTWVGKDDMIWFCLLEGCNRILCVQLVEVGRSDLVLVLWGYRGTLFTHTVSSLLTTNSSSREWPPLLISDHCSTAPGSSLHRSLFSSASSDLYFPVFFSG